MVPISNQDPRRRPLVAIVARTFPLDGMPTVRELRLRGAYVDALASAGSMPVVLPLRTLEENPATVGKLFDGFVLPGGDDEPQASELRAVRALVDLGRPLLGICRGEQVINLALGGDLIDDLPQSTVIHRDEERDPEPTHAIQIAPDSRLFRIVGCASLKVNSIHRQAVGRIGGGLKVGARASDGVVEAIEATDHRWIVGVQYHPERSYAVSEASTRLIAAFVEECVAVHRSSSEQI